MLIEYTNSLIGTGEKYICVSRPRRFGKSTDVDMLVAYYSKGCDSHNQFGNLKIANTSDYMKHLNKHNVIRIDMYDFIDFIYESDSLNKLHEMIIMDLRKAYDFSADINTLSMAFNEIFSNTHDKFIFIIDEWDSIIREFKDNKRIQKSYLRFLNILLKGKPYVEFVYMTGILPITKYGNESVLNMFDEISFLNPYPLERFMGFTEDEVKELCEQYDISFESMKSWYNGYNIGNNLSVYNPRSVVQSIKKRNFANYWTGTQTYEMLKGYLNTDPELRPNVIDLINDKEVKVDVTSFQNDITTFKSKDDVLTLLIHLGYLGYNAKNKTVYIPNKEIKDEFVTTLKNANWGFITRFIQQSESLLEATITQDEETVAKILEDVHLNIEARQYNNEYHLSSVINIAYIAAREYYTIINELPSGKGYADIAYIPKPGVNKPAMIVELKYNSPTVESALDQIRERRYDARLNHYKDDLLYVGINYTEDKKHSCKIEKV
jgi:hypothetical protein